MQFLFPFLISAFVGRSFHRRRKCVLSQRRCVWTLRGSRKRCRGKLSLLRLSLVPNLLNWSWTPREQKRVRIWISSLLCNCSTPPMFARPLCLGDDIGPWKGLNVLYIYSDKNLLPIFSLASSGLMVCSLLVRCLHYSTHGSWGCT